VPTYLRPGVFVETIAARVDGPRVRPRPSVDATTALGLLEAWYSVRPPLFVGFTSRGPIGEPVLVVGPQMFENMFGGSPAGSPFSSCVLTYFACGGESCWVVRAPPDSAHPDELPAGPRSRSAIMELLSRDLLELVSPFSVLAVPDSVGAAATAPGVPDHEAAFQLHLTMIQVCEGARAGAPILDAPMLPTVTDVVSWRTTSVFDRSQAIIVYPWSRARNLERHDANAAIPSSCAVAALLCGPAPDFGDLGGVEPIVILDHDDAQRLLESGVTPVLTTISDGGRVDALPPRRGDIGMPSPGRQLESSIYDAIARGTSWAIFRVSEPKLWARLETEISSFLDVLWRRGHLDGESAEVAYDVRCDETTNVRDASQVNTSVTFQVAPGERHQLNVVHFLG